MKSTKQWFLAALISLFSIGLFADQDSSEVRIELLREDISDWVVDEDSIWLKLSEPALARFSVQLASMPFGKRFKVYLEEVELVSLHWHGEGEPGVIMAPISEATLGILQQ
ncbi:MAG: hypothetical protein ACX931_12440 [Saccharospirillum sp.]